MLYFFPNWFQNRAFFPEIWAGVLLHCQNIYLELLLRYGGQDSVVFKYWLSSHLNRFVLNEVCKGQQQNWIWSFKLYAQPLREDLQRLLLAAIISLLILNYAIKRWQLVLLPENHVMKAFKVHIQPDTLFWLFLVTSDVRNTKTNSRFVGKCKFINILIIYVIFFWGGGKYLSQNCQCLHISCVPFFFP